MRIKRGVAHVKHRKNILKATRGYKWGRKNQIKKAKTAITRAGRHAYKHRRLKKREYRGVWNVRINAGARLNGTTYSRLISALKTKKIDLDRKVLSQIAAEYPDVFAAIVAATK